MTADIETATDEVTALFKAAWDAESEAADFQILYWNKPDDPPAVPDDDKNPPPWVKIIVRHQDASPAGMGSDTGRRKKTRYGIVTVQIFEGYGTGGAKANRLARVAEAAFDGKETPSGVWFRRVRTVDFGRSGPWYRTDVLAEFEYDDVIH